MPTSFETLPQMLDAAARQFENPKAVGSKTDGRWVYRSTSEVRQTVERLAHGLRQLGLEDGDRVAMAADSSPLWMMMDLAILMAGGVTVPLFSNIAPDNLEFEIRDSGTRFLFIGSPLIFRAVQPHFGGIERILTAYDPLPDDRCIGFRQLEKLGEERRAALRAAGGAGGGKEAGEGKPADGGLGRAKPGDVATIIYTSGSTGIPKGVVLTHANLVSQVQATRKRFPVDPLEDSALSCLPLAHVFERMVTYYYLSQGITISFSEDVKQVGADLRELHPTVITMVPRLLEKAYAKMAANAEAATGLRKKLAARAFARANERPAEGSRTLADRAFDLLVYGKLRQAMGGRLRLVISGSAPLDPQLNLFFLNAGIPVYEGYGLTECSPVLAANFPGRRKVGTVGPVFPGVEVRIGDDGEILARGPNIMQGYHNRPDETALVIDRDGWLHTGDIGHLDTEGFLRITGRKKELFKTANGKFVAPVPIEQALSGNKLVDLAMVIAEGRPFTTCLLFPDFENLKGLQAERGMSHLAPSEYVQSADARIYAQQAVNAINAKLNAWEKVKRFRIIPAPLTVDSGQLTPTMKLRRHIVEERYREEIEALYRSETPAE